MGDPAAALKNSFRLDSKSGPVSFAPRMPLPRLKTPAFLFLAGLLTVAWARGAEAAGKPADTLLDPAKLGGRANKAAPPGELLDPAKLGAPAGTKPGGTETGSAPSGTASKMDRGMAGSTVVALDQLTRDCAALVREMDKLLRETQELSAQLATLQQAMARTMEEYRNGLFCSGCNRTKSQILATGSSFPHPGQEIIRPTPEQLAAKERELQGPIDRLARQRRETQDRWSRKLAERDEALLQIEAGHQLWVTSVSYQHLLIAAADRASEERYQQEHRKAEAQLSRLLVEVNRDDAAGRAAHQREVDHWTAIRRQAAQQRAADQHQTRVDYARAGQAARGDCDNLNTFFNREDLRRVLTLVASVKLISPPAGLNAAGGLFRMGDHSPARHDEVLPNVRSFIARFDALPPTGFRVVNNFVEYEKPLAPSDPGILPNARKLLRDYVNALPPDENGKPKRKSDPGGIRD